MSTRFFGVFFLSPLCFASEPLVSFSIICNMKRVYVAACNQPLGERERERCCIPTLFAREGQIFLCWLPQAKIFKLSPAVKKTAGVAASYFTSTSGVCWTGLDVTPKAESGLSSRSTSANHILHHSVCVSSVSMSGQYFTLYSCPARFIAGV